MNNVLDAQPATPTASDATRTAKWEQRPLVPNAFWFVRDNYGTMSAWHFLTKRRVYSSYLADRRTNNRRQRMSLKAKTFGLPFEKKITVVHGLKVFNSQTTTCNID